MDTEALIQNINFSQKLFLLLFLLWVSYFYLRSCNWKLKKIKENDDEIFSHLITSLKYYFSYIYLLLLPLLLLLLNMNISFNIFLGIMVGFYSVLFIVATATFLYKNGKKLWETIEGWF